MTSIIVRVGLLMLVLVSITLFPWPDISGYLSFISTAINRLYFLNRLVDMDTVFAIMKITLVIEMILLSRKLFIAIVHFISTGSFKGGETTEE